MTFLLIFNSKALYFLKLGPIFVGIATLSILKIEKSFWWSYPSVCILELILQNSPPNKNTQIFDRQWGSREDFRGLLAFLEPKRNIISPPLDPHWQSALQCTVLLNNIYNLNAGMAIASWGHFTRDWNPHSRFWMRCGYLCRHNLCPSRCPSAQIKNSIAACFFLTFFGVQTFPAFQPAGTGGQQ